MVKQAWISLTLNKVRSVFANAEKSLFPATQAAKVSVFAVEISMFLTLIFLFLITKCWTFIY